MLESLAASCLAAGVAFQWVAEHRRSRAGMVTWAAMWLALVGSLIHLLVGSLAGVYASPHRWRSMTMEGGREAVAMIRKTKGDVLSEDIGLLVIAGRRVLLDPHKMTSMFRDGRWDQHRLVRDIKRKRFALIITEWDPVAGATDEWGTYGNYRWSIGMGRAIMRNYYLVKQAGFLYITAPADARHPSCAEVHRHPELEREREQ